MRKPLRKLYYKLKCKMLGRENSRFKYNEYFGFFDFESYAELVDQPLLSKHEALYHYLKIGWKEGLDPSDQFSTSAYLLMYPDVSDQGINPLKHYLAYGKADGKKPVNTSQLKLRQYMDVEWYTTTHNLPPSTDVVGHCAYVGLTQGYSPCPELADDDGKSLAPWGREFLVRSGVKVGALGTRLLQCNDKAINAFQISNPGKKKIAVVTAIFGGFDRLIPVNPDWADKTDFFLFTDQYFDPHGVWQHVHANYYNDDPRHRARFVKTHLPTYFSEYDWVFWVDGNVLICEDPAVVLKKLSLGDCDFATFQHPDRINLISEAAACIRFGKETPLIIINHLRQNHAHPNFGSAMLFETMVMAMRPASPSVRAMCTVWWRAMMRGSKRDQLSLPLAVSETKDLRVGLIPNNIGKSFYFAKAEHQL